MSKSLDKVRAKWMETIRIALLNEADEILRTASNELCIPIVGEDGEEGYLVMTFKIPTGSRDDKEPYDGYAVAEDYKQKCNTKAIKAKEAAEKKAAKIKRDEEIRKQKAEAKAKKENAE